MCLPLQALYRRSTGEKLGVKWLGKPTRATFEFAQEQLVHTAEHQWQSKVSGLDQIYMVGDNPEADIRGANAVGNPWKSILVRSGVFSGVLVGDDKPWHIADGVSDAVDMLLEDSSTRN